MDIELFCILARNSIPSIPTKSAFIMLKTVLVLEKERYGGLEKKKKSIILQWGDSLYKANEIWKSLHNPVSS